MTAMLLKKSILNIRMLLSVLVSFAILLSSMFINGQVPMFITNSFTQGWDLLTLYTVPFAYSSFVIFAGLFPGLPYAYSYLEEQNSGYLKFIQVRMSRKKYAVQKIYFAGLSGGLSMLLTGILIFIVLDVMSFDTTVAQHPPIFEELVWAPWMYIWGGRLVLLLKAILLFLFGVLWSELALFFSLIVRNKYVAFVLPFIVYEMLWILMGGTILNPVFILRFDFGIEYPLYSAYFVFTVYILLLVIINRLLFKRQGRR